MDYKICKIPKRNGKFRTIYIPDKEYKAQLRYLLTEKFFQKKFPYYVTAFVHDNNIVTNAKQHIGYNFTLSFDLEDFFDSVTTEHFNHFSEKNRDLITDCFINDRLRQGLPTSPFLSNLAALSMDEVILRNIKRTFLKNNLKYYERTEDLDEIEYTRYADDLAFSFNNYSTYPVLKTMIPNIVNSCRFKINSRKTHLQTAKFGFRRICGINVGPDRVKVPKHIDKKLRACIHLNKKWDDMKHVVMGLREFIKLKKPDLENKKNIKQACRILHKFNMSATAKKLRVIEPAIPDGDYGGVTITNDPVYFVGMSLFTTDWRSCMSLRRGGNAKKGVWVWNNLQGCSIAYIPSSRIVTIAGISRKAMIRRVLVFETEDGGRYYGTCYPNSHMIADKLYDAGFKPVREGRGKRVKGRIVNRKCMPWQDSTKIIWINERKYIRFEL